MELKKDKDKITTKQMLSAGLCDDCKYPAMMNTGNGIDEPENPILWCNKVDAEIEPVPLECQLIYCQHYCT